MSQRCAGLVSAVSLIEPIKEKYPGVTYADLFQLASATAIEVLFPPTIEKQVELNPLCPTCYLYCSGGRGAKNPYEIWKSGYLKS